MLAYYFFSPEKDLATGTALRLRIKTQALLNASAQEAAKSYQKILKAKQEERLALFALEAGKLWRKLQETYKKNAFLDYISELKTMITGLLATVREEIATIAGGDAEKISGSMPTSLKDFSGAMRAWVELNEKRLHAISGVDADEAETKARDELIKLQRELRSAYEKLAQLIVAVPDIRKGFVPASYRGGTFNVNAKAGDEEAKLDAGTDKLPPAPQEILDTFSKRYLNRELRKTPYHFKDLKILKSAHGSVPGFYCISFSAEVYHNHDNRRWEKSPVILNVIAKVGTYGIMSTYENFAKNPWEYPVSGSCVKPLWGVHDYVWDKICPYPCMGK